MLTLHLYCLIKNGELREVLTLHLYCLIELRESVTLGLYFLIINVPVLLLYLLNCRHVVFDLTRQKSRNKDHFKNNSRITSTAGHSVYGLETFSTYTYFRTRNSNLSSIFYKNERLFFVIAQKLYLVFLAVTVCLLYELFCNDPSFHFPRKRTKKKIHVCGNILFRKKSRVGGGSTLTSQHSRK